MKQTAFTFFLFLYAYVCAAQPMADTTGKLVEQKEKIITDSTIVKIENLGFRVNSELPELRPTISADGNLLFFICEAHPDNTHAHEVRNSQDIWYSVRDTVTGKWTDAVHLGYPFNTAHYNAVYWISPDKNRILLRNAFIDGDYYGNGVSMSEVQKDGRWSKPNMLKIKNYSKYDKGFQSGASMSSDGQVLLLYMSEESKSRSNKIYVCFQQTDGTWSEPKSIGKKINLPGYNQMTPYLAADGVTLYFSSDRPGGFGDHDIWKTKRLDESWQKWSDPINLGEPINSADFDAFFTLDAGGEYAYLTSSFQSLGKSDIVRVQLLEIERPDPVVLVSGNVYNAKTKQPLSANLLYETLPDGVLSGNGLSSPGDGAFKIVLPYDKNYLIRATADHFFAQSENLNLDSLVRAGYKEIHKDLYLVPIEIGQIVRLNNVFFDFDKWDLRPVSFVELNRVVKMLNDNPAISIELGAHTDSKGSDDYNIKLSHNRAQSVMQYILSKGIAAERVSFKGYGETVPVATNDTDEGRQLNRRVEFKILSN
ncbi:MAG: OmpA family protein [Chitinophagaceae bacterium]|nr:OmpA family protein [Chitinophagaceae bacterium]